MMFVLVFGFLSARWAQSQKTRESLKALSQTTATGLQLVLDGILINSEQLSNDSTVVQAVETFARDGQVPPELSEAVRARLSLETQQSPNRPSRIRLYDASGMLIVSTAPDDVQGEPYNAALPWRDDDGSTFYSFTFEGDTERRLFADIRSSVKGGVDGEPLGYVMESRDLTPMLSFAFGRDPQNPSRSASTVVAYQLVFRVGETYGAVQMSPSAPMSTSNIEQVAVSPELAAAFLDENENLSKTLHIDEYPVANDVVVDAFISYHRIPMDPEVYVAVYQTADLAYAAINRGAGIALLLSTLFIAVMCLNAYRNVHNNIVRPVSLLNEGAQIVGQGDLELKLVIDTGDEIHELAQSFNKMALALKRNIGQLEDSEERYRSLVTAMRDGIFHADSEERLTFVNQAGLEIFGFETMQGAVGTRLSTLFRNKSDLQRIRRELKEDGFNERSRIWMKRDDGREIIVEVSFNTVHDDDGDVTGTEGTFRDVTKSVQLEQESRERSERIAAINQIANVINSSLEAGRLYESLVAEVKRLVDFDYAALALLDPEGQLFTVRQLWPAHERTAEVTYDAHDESFCSSQVAKQRAHLLIGDITVLKPTYASQFPEDTRGCLCIPLYATGRIIGTLNLGSTRPSAFSKHDVEVLEQMAPHVAVAIRNARLLENLQSSLEEVTQAREKLHEANAELKTLDEMKTNLLSNVSHELRTPLVSVMGYTDMIYNEKVGTVNDTQREYLGISLRNIERLVTLIENLLDFSRLHQGDEKVVFDTLDLIDCAKSSMQVLEPVANGRKIALVLDAPDTPILVEGDKGKLGQVFNNLLSNAVKFNQAGGTVTVTIDPTPESINVSVSDTGIGISEDALDKVFTRFYQYDSSSTRKYGGTGIGLAIAQDIIRLHGGHITVTSVPGEGSTFRFNLANPAARESSLPAEGVPAPRETELLVELVSTDRALSHQLHHMLESEGMEIINASSLDGAVAMAQRYLPNCLILDADNIEDPDQYLTKLQEQKETSSLPIVIITNDEAFWDGHRQPRYARLKRDFRKSTLIGGIRSTLAASVKHEHDVSLGNRVLCVDDDREILTFIERCLRQEDLDVDIVQSGAEAVEKANSQNYDTVLLDVAMPGLDGWETCRRIKSNPALAGIRVFMVTAKPVDLTEERDRQLRPDGVLYKPFHPEELLDLFHQVNPAPASD